MQSEEKARRVIQFIECLKHTKGEFHGQPFKLLPWQEQIIRDVFGTVRDEDPSIRQYTTAYIEIPKKQGKSELGAAIALNMLCNDDEWRAEVYSCASEMNGVRRFTPARQIASRRLSYSMWPWTW